jgi:hypothetical protein
MERRQFLKSLGIGASTVSTIHLFATEKRLNRWDYSCFLYENSSQKIWKVHWKK